MTLDADMAPGASSEGIVGPFTEMRSTATELVWHTLGDNIPFDLHWRVLLFTLLIAATIWFLRNGKGSKGADGRARQSGFLEFIFPRDVYTPPSARVDIWLWISERLIHPFWAVGLLATVGPATITCSFITRGG